VTRGALITVEGVEGVGKSTCLKFIEASLRARGHSPIVTREPGGTPLGEQIRDWVLHGKHGPLSAEIEAVLMCAARAVHVDEVIRPALSAGTWVLCDRFSDATIAYQGGGRGAQREFLEQLLAAVQGSLMPDLTLLLDAPVEVGLERIRDREHDHFEREDRDFFERVRASYLELARDDPDRLKIVDAARGLAQVEQQVMAHLQSFLRRFGAPND
jgi:dTMP kinase